MRLKYFLFVFALSYSAVLIAQPGKKEDVIYLKNESVIRGTIIDRNDTRIKIQAGDGSIWVYATGEIIRVTKENKYGSYEYNRKGFAHFTELGPLVAGKTSIDGVTTAAFSFQTVNGYRFSQYLFAGAGVGVDLYATQTMVPLIASLRGDFSVKGTVIPFYIAEGGYSINITQSSPGNTDFKGGVTYAFGLGAKIPFNRSAGFLVSFAYRYQASSYYLNTVKKEIQYNRLAIRAGFFL
jgi:hypothetical protein